MASLLLPWGLGPSAGPAWGRPNRNGPTPPPWGLGPPEPQWATAAAVGPEAVREARGGMAFGGIQMMYKYYLMSQNITQQIVKY